MRIRRVTCVLVLVLLGSVAAVAQIPPAPPPAMPRGLVDSKPAVSDGYVLFSPILSGTTYLIRNDGRVVHTWSSELTGTAMYLLPNGNLLRGARDPDILHFLFGGVTGILQEIDWSGDVVWERRLGDAKRVLHHDLEPLPNGNLLALAWELKTPEQAIAAGRRPEAVPEMGLMSEYVIEIEPVRPRGGKIVWEWHIWDHLVQDHAPEALHYGDPAEHPGLLDLNVGAGAPPVSEEEL
ncbi:MAG: aryl-sulfate sulfotransferase, partial [Myxococcota bacterium]